MPTVILATPNPIPALRLVASPDLVAGETIEWGNVVGGLDGDVTVTPDATWTAATGVASFDWRVFDGAWGEWATQNITASGVTLNQNQYFLSGGIQGGGAATAVSGAANQYFLSGGIQSGGASEVSYQGALNQYSFTSSGGITALGQAVVVSGTSTQAPLSGEFYLTFAGYNPMQHSRFLSLKPAYLGTLLPGSDNQLPLSLSYRENGVETPLDMSTVTRVRLVLSTDMEIDQTAGVLPAHLEWSSAVPGELLINPGALFSGGYRPGTYPIRLEIYRSGAAGHLTIPTEDGSYLSLP